MMSTPEKPSLLTQVEQIVSAQPEGIRGGVIVDGKTIGAEVAANLDPGKPGGFTLGFVARVTKGKDKLMALMGGWTPGR